MVTPPTTGVLLTQLGTPDAPTPAAVRRYLAEFLSDRRMVDLPRALWLPLLHGVILRFRPRRSAALYRHIWRPDGSSPLLYHTQTVARAMEARLGPTVLTRFAMRYGKPPLADTIHDMVNAGISRLLIFPLFPQFSASTTGAMVDGVHAALAKRRFLPTLRFAPPFFDEAGAIEALANRVRSTIAPETDPFYLFSFHGLPQRHVTEGDPYGKQCIVTARLLARALRLSDRQWDFSFQSRFGREQWLLPNTADRLRQLPQEGKQRLVMVCPGFVADCLETLEEIAIQGRQQFLAAGGKQFQYVPCLNDAPDWITVLAGMVWRELAGWEVENEPRKAQP